MKRLTALIATLVLMIGAGFPATAQQDDLCGAPEKPCKIDGGSYNISLPEGWAGGPAVIHLHGYGGSGAKVVGNKAFVARITVRGYALIAPSGLPWKEGKPKQTEWSVRDGYDAYPRDDVAFLRAVLDDAAKRFGIDRSRVLMTGFSRGASMVWDVACIAPDMAAAYAPVAGGFWESLPTDCVGPVKLLHTHGFKDRTVPLEGRRLTWEGLNFVQGDIYQGLQLWRQINGCSNRAGEHVIEEKIWRKVWTDCTQGAALEFALHPGGHGLPKGWSAMVLDWFEAQLASSE